MITSVKQLHRNYLATVSTRHNIFRPGALLVDVATKTSLKLVLNPNIVKCRLPILYLLIWWISFNFRTKHGNDAAVFHYDVIKWKHFCALLVICAGNSPVPGEFPTQRPVTRSFGVLFFICAFTNGLIINRKAGHLRRYSVHYDIIVM